MRDPHDLVFQTEFTQDFRGAGQQGNNPHAISRGGKAVPVGCDLSGNVPGG